jgi:hypothetical protein
MDDPRPSIPRPPQADSDVATEQLTQQLSALTDVLESVDDDPRLIDASLDDVHAIVARLGKAAKHRIGNLASLGDGLDHPLYDIFEQARANENDTYEVYADVLERHHQRQRRDLTIEDFDSDKSATVKRRRNYINTLFEIHMQISNIINL